MKPIFNMLRAAKLFIVLDNSIEQIQVVNRCAMFEIANPNDETVGIRCYLKSTSHRRSMDRIDVVPTG